MKPFKINRNTWHYKLNQYFLNSENMKHEWEPSHNSFCSYWRSTMLRGIIAIAIAAAAILVLTMIGAAAIANPYAFFMVILQIIVVVAFLVTIIVLLVLSDERMKRRNKNPEQYESKSLFVQKYKAYKAKVCPIVEYES